MSDEKALLAAIDAHPLDDAPRLVYADWLDERGGAANVARAEFIRVQCELDLLPSADPRYPALNKRQEELLKTRRKEWTQPLKKSQGRNVEFRRGFPVPSLSHLSVNELVKLTERDLRAAPLWHGGYGTTGRNFAALLRWPQLHRLTTFCLRPPLPKAGWAERVAACAGLRNVTELVFIGCRALTAADLKTVLDAWTGRRLWSLWINECPVGDAGLRVIAGHPAVAGLRLLRAHTAGCTSRGIKAVADSPYLDRLELATFAHNPIGATGGKHLLRWKALDTIRDLYLMNTGLPPALQTRFRERLGPRVRL
jgi:uncharacterized protein (TIGR02996 family)